MKKKWVIAGLGNPGADYEKSRHSAGRMMLDELVKVYKTDFSGWEVDRKKSCQTGKVVINNQEVILVKPETFMNRSGQAVGHFIKSKDGLSRLIVAHDDVDLPLGVIKMSVGRGSGGHKGVESVFRSVKSKEFTRLRIGISPITASGKIKKAGGKPVEEFVIADFKLAELAELKKIFKKGILKIEEIIK